MSAVGSGVSFTASKAVQLSPVLSALVKSSVFTPVDKLIKLYLYTKENPTNPEFLNQSSVEELKKSKFNATLPTRIIIHGFMSNYNDGPNTFLRKAYMEKGDFNVISVDWSPRADALLYNKVAAKVEDVGRELAAFLDLAKEHIGLSFETLEVVGHSLGAHCAGFAGKNVKNGRIHTIRGLDPASPLFYFDKPKGRLASTDAIYVESIHTNAGHLGFKEPIGQVAFYPNGGSSQPGCGLDIGYICSHGRSFEYLAEAITGGHFQSISCNSFKDALDRKCCNTNNTMSTSLGSFSDSISETKIFYVPVNKTSPFHIFSKITKHSECK